jgi:bifunctional non-homologous end joining protein LigD
MEKEKTITVQGHKLVLTNQDKVYWPEEEITKGDVVQYYNAVYRYIIKYLKDRPQSLKRNPNGIRDKGFFQKDAGDAAPSWVESIEITAESNNRKIDYILCNDKATLLYLNNLGCIELNPWNSRVTNLDKPDYLVIDVDPSEANEFEDVIDATLAVKAVLEKAGAEAYCKTSGATGLHVYVPLHAEYSYDQIRSFAEVIALLAFEQLPDLTTVERPLSKRKGRVYLDYLQNSKGQTLASAYSLRPHPGATVSAPLQWKEVKQGLHPSQFTIHTIGRRLEKKGDLFAPVLTHYTDIRKCLKNLGV